MHKNTIRLTLDENISLIFSFLPTPIEYEKKRWIGNANKVTIITLKVTTPDKALYNP